MIRFRLKTFLLTSLLVGAAGGLAIRSYLDQPTYLYKGFHPHEGALLGACWRTWRGKQELNYLVLVSQRAGIPCGYSSIHIEPSKNGVTCYPTHFVLDDSEIWPTEARRVFWISKTHEVIPLEPTDEAIAEFMPVDCSQAAIRKTKLWQQVVVPMLTDDGSGPQLP